MTDVAAIIVTRGDQDLTPVLAALPSDWEVVVWDNSREQDLAIYGRYAAIERTEAELIYVQDDDCVVADPAFIVDTFITAPADAVICNMPQEFRHDFYVEHALVGFGAAFHRDAPERAFARLFGEPYSILQNMVVHGPWEDGRWLGWFHRTCDIVFTALTPRVLVDVPKDDLPWAHHETRMWKQSGHLAERARMLDLVRQVSVGSEQSTGR